MHLSAQDGHRGTGGSVRGAGAGQRALTPEVLSGSLEARSGSRGTCSTRSVVKAGTCSAVGTYD